jgi:two-component system sensor kinase FixL
MPVSRASSSRYRPIRPRQDPSNALEKHRDGEVVTALPALGVGDLTQARWNAILDTALDAIVCIDAAGAMTVFNRAAEAMFGYRADEVIGQNVALLMSSPYRENHDGYMERYHAGGAARAIGRVREVEARRKNGQIFPIELSVSEARVDEQVIYSAFIRDVSERHAMERELTEARRLAGQRERLADIGAITARIVHDLGNPLAGVSMQAQLINRRVRREPERPARDLAKPAELIVSEVKRLDGLIKDFLDFARQQRVELRTLLIRSFIERAVELWRSVATARDIALVLDVAPDADEIEADEDKLRRVLDNLLKNAIEAVAHGPGRVDVRVVRNGEQIRITVTDSGPGIAEGVEIFRLFESTKRDGTGLGLPIAKQIVLAHGGTIGFERLSPAGTAFHVDLPIRGVANERVLPIIDDVTDGLR